MRDELGTAEATLGRVGRAGVCEHDEGVACRQVDLIASYREKGENLRLRKAEELSQASTNNILHVFIDAFQDSGCRSSFRVFSYKRAPFARLLAATCTLTTKQPDPTSTATEEISNKNRGDINQKAHETEVPL